MSDTRRACCPLTCKHCHIAFPSLEQAQHRGPRGRDKSTAPPTFGAPLLKTAELGLIINVILLDDQINKQITSDSKIYHNIIGQQMNNQNSLLANNNEQNTGYARLPDYQQPVQPVHQPVIMRDPVNYGQPIYHPNQGYNQGYNQGFNNQGYVEAQPYFNPNQGPLPHNQGFDNNMELLENGRGIRCLAMTAIIQNIVYILYDILYYGFTLNYLFIFMIIQGIMFGVLAGKVTNGMATTQQFNSVKKTFLCTMIFYSVYFTIIIIILGSIDVDDYDVDKATIIIVFAISSFIFLLPRAIAIFVTKGRRRRQGLVMVQ